jgi:hypothetical protein
LLQFVFKIILLLYYFNEKVYLFEEKINAEKFDNIKINTTT